ncbi:MAG: OmpH family outer membrane protein [Caulobacter sp.]|nr:OmpH family outer membrane protein [Caulobacter sp.]
MPFNKTLAVAAGAAAVLAFASAVAAQTPPARPAAAAPARPAAAAPAMPPVRHGPALPGVCTYSGEQAIQDSEVGKYVTARIKQIVTEVNAELQAEDLAIKNEAKAIDAARATAQTDALEARAAALQARFNAYKRKQQLREAEVEQTRRKALMRVLQELDPIAVGVYQARNCSILLGDGVLLGNPAMDITPQVITGLNAKIKSFAFNRERLDTPAPGAPGAPPRTN